MKNTYLFKDTLELSDANMKIYDGLGHVPMEEAPEITVIAFINFLKSIHS